ncbi:MAG: RND family transporter [Saprospiraceae bacterium]
MSHNQRRIILTVFSLLAVVSIYYSTQLKFAFSLEQFFPEGDKDLAYFKEFEKNFEQDVNFLLVALPREEGVFDSTFLTRVKSFTEATYDLPLVGESQSLATIQRPIKTPFGITAVPFIHIDDPSRYESDKKKVLEDERLVYTLIDKDATALIVAMKTEMGMMDLEESNTVVDGVEALLEKYEFDDYHLLGPAYFAREMVSMQQREVLVTSLVSGVLVSIIMFLIFRRFWGTILALVSIALGMLIFLGFMGVTQRPLNAMSALYPMLMIIVGTSDVIHIMTKYIDELRRGSDKKSAIKVTIKEIGLATLLTSMTTAIGFMALVTSKIIPIRDFGINSAVGVMIAYITVLLFTTAVVSLFKTEQLIKIVKQTSRWDDVMSWANQLTIDHPRRIILGGLFFFVFSLYGISQISTNYSIESNLPRGEKLSTDFFFFEEKMAGFRPIEYAVYPQGDYQADDFEVLQQMDKLEQHLREIDHLQSVQSLTTVYKSLHQMYNGNRTEAYRFPEDKNDFLKYKKLASKAAGITDKILLSPDKKIARISTRAKDIGADRINEKGEEIKNWISQNLDPNIAVYKETGTGLIMDKNGEYIRENLLEGLGVAILVISILMALLFKNWRMVFISLVPNLLPLLLAGAMLGYLGIQLEAGVSIIFAIIFGIAVDDTMHFLSKYKLSIDKGLTVDEAISVTFRETGKAICLTSIILFFGFLIMLTSIHPPSVTIGILISITLISAVVGDLMLIPILLRWMMKPKVS